MFVGRDIFFFEFAVFLWVIPLAMFGLAIPYMAARLRESTGEPDPHIGIKTAHHLFMTAGIFLMLSAFTVICVSILELDTRPGGMARGPFLEQDEIRVSFALLAVGGLFAVLHALMLLATNDGRQRAVRRLFTGLRFVTSGMVVMVSLAILLSHLFRKNTEFREIRPFLGILIVWVPCWFLHMAFLLVGTPRTTPPRPPGTETFYDD